MTIETRLLGLWSGPPDDLNDPLAGRRPPAREKLGGRGLLLVHSLADLVRIHTGLDGTAVRCYLGQLA